MKTITIRLDDELHKKFKLYATKHDSNMQELIEEFIKKLVEENEEE